MRTKINIRALLSISCLLIILLLLVACNKSKTENETNESDITAAETETEDVTVTETAEETTQAETEEETSEEAFIPIIRFAVCSDIHLTNGQCEQASRLEKLFESAYRYAENSPDYKNLDAVIMVGDMTNTGYFAEYSALKKIISGNTRPETRIITVMGNHEQFGGNIATYRNLMGEDENKHIVINGFHFIGISTTEYPDFHNYSDETVAWLGEELARAAADGSEKPIFTFQHLHISKTVYGSGLMATPKSSAIKKVYANYPQIINFSGDSHAPINHPKDIFQESYTSINTGTLFYFEMEPGMTNGTLPLGKEQAAQYLIVEVDGNNTVKVHPYNILTDSVFKTPSNTDDPECDLEYTVKNPSDKSGFTYTKAAGANASNPYFGEGAVPTVLSVSDKSVTLTVPQAYDDCCIYSYECRANPTGGGKSVKYSCFSEYYFEPMPETVTFTVCDLKPDTEYELNIYPVNAWDKKGQPISVKVKTLPKPEVKYESQNDVTYSGTFTDFDSIDDLKIRMDGDVFAGNIDVTAADSNVTLRLSDGGYNGSKGLSVSRRTNGNSAFTVNATADNGNTTDFSGTEYLRVYIDMTGIDFRKASFGLIDSDGVLYSTDNNDNSNPEIYLLADGETRWRTVKTGNDGCFGSQESESLKDFKGWIAVRISDMRSSGGAGGMDNLKIKAFYMYWDYLSIELSASQFIIDEIHLVADYKIFEEYTR